MGKSDVQGWTRTVYLSFSLFFFVFHCDMVVLVVLKGGFTSFKIDPVPLFFLRVGTS